MFTFNFLSCNDATGCWIGNQEVVFDSPHIGCHYTQLVKKTAPFYFCNNFVKLSSIFYIIFGTFVLQ